MPLINFAGLASGIDSEALIDALSESLRNQRVVPNETKIAELEETNTALEELRSKLLSLQSIARGFSTLSGGILLKNASSTDESKITATASNSAANGTYAPTVTQRAKNATFSFASTSRTYTGTSDAINPNINDGAAESPNRTVTVTVGTGSFTETVNIPITSTTTITDFVTSFNSVSTKGVATLVNVGTSSSPDYRPFITTSNEGLERGQIAVTVGTEITTAGGGSFNSNTTSQATNATLTMAGFSGTITRASNTISDIIPGVTFVLQNTGTATITVSDDTAGTQARVQEFIDAYNEIVAFVDEGNLIESEQDGKELENIFGPLSKTRSDDGILSSLRSAISGSSYSGGSTVKIFADMGITTERDGTLKFDTNTFSTAITTEPNSVKEIWETFSDTVSLTGGTIDSYVKFGGLFDITINGNETLVTDLNDRIARAEEQIGKQEEALRLRFARLESLIGRLQSQQNALSSALASLGS